MRKVLVSGPFAIFMVCVMLFVMVFSAIVVTNKNSDIANLREEIKKSTPLKEEQSQVKMACMAARLRAMDITRTLRSEPDRAVEQAFEMSLWLHLCGPDGPEVQRGLSAAIIPQLQENPSITPSWNVDTEKISTLLREFSSKQ